VPIEQRRYDFIRLLRQAPAITEALYVDGQGREQLRLSRLEPDVLDSGADLSADARFRGTREGRVWYGPVTFRRGSEPYMALAMAHAGRNPGATIAEVNLKLIWEVITGIRVGGSGYAFVTDTAGRLIAHPDMSLVLRETDLSALPQVADAIAGRDERVRTARTLSGQSPARVRAQARADAGDVAWLSKHHGLVDHGLQNHRRVRGSDRRHRGTAHREVGAYAGMLFMF
jgi:hypothetical protein